MPRVSIGLPVFNGEEYLERSISSVLEQRFVDFELIVADNASTDGTMSIIERFAAADDRVVVLRSDENRGAAWNYNRVVEAAQGEFFRWHAHDDEFTPDLIGRLVDALDASPGAVLAHSSTRFVDGDGATVQVFDDDLGATSDRPSERLRSVMRRLTFCNAVFGLIRRDRLETTALIASFPGADVSLLYELALLGTFEVVPEPLFVRRPGNSIKSNPGTKAVAEWFAPTARGRRVPGLHIWWATVRAIMRADLAVGERVASLTACVTVWPLERVRRLRRRSRRRAR